jgi:phosphatidylglycerophosphate synthase
VNRHPAPQIPEQLVTAPSLITSSRFIVTAILWVFAVAKRPFYVGIGLVLAGGTDLLDGLVARRLGQATAFGSKLDSAADAALFVSAIAWILALRPEVVTENLGLVCASLLLNALSLLVGWLKFRRFANLHLYSSKAATAAAYLFLVDAFTFGPHRGLLYITVGTHMLCSTEALLLQLTRSHIDEHVRSIVLR